MNLTLEEYQHASDPEIEALINYIERARPDLRFDSFITGTPYQLPRFKFSRLKNMYFVYIPGGKFKMGLSEAEEWAARQIEDAPRMNINAMRPVTEVSVNSFLVAETPFLARHAFSMQAYVQLAEVETHHELMRRPNYKHYTWFDTAQELAKALHAQLPTERQREYFCRGNTNTLFCFGNTLPDRAALNDWFNGEFDDLKEMKRNNFGIGGLFMTEWCSDYFRADYATDKTSATARAIRGGGADLFIFRSIFNEDRDWGYFENEKDWVWCASAIRMSSTRLVDETAGFRLVINLE